MRVKDKKLLSEVADYYSKKIIRYGQTPSGVDWNSASGQMLRFEQLCRVIDGERAFTLNDLGCGYGALFDFLADQFNNFKYTGIDVSEEMIRVARQRYEGQLDSRFVISSKPDCVSDYSLASGIFNVRQSCPVNEWERYVHTTLDVLDQSSTKGFAFNCLTSYSDKDKRQEYLFYANPCALFDLCKSRYSKNVALLHDYDLYEFTILVKKNL